MKFSQLMINEVQSTATMKAFAAIDKDMVTKACDSFHTCLEMVIAAGSNYIEK